MSSKNSSPKKPAPENRMSANGPSANGPPISLRQRTSFPFRYSTKGPCGRAARTCGANRCECSHDSAVNRRVFSHNNEHGRTGRTPENARIGSRKGSQQGTSCHIQPRSQSCFSLTQSVFSSPTLTVRVCIRIKRSRSSPFQFDHPGRGRQTQELQLPLTRASRVDLPRLAAAAQQRPRGEEQASRAPRVGRLSEPGTVRSASLVEDWEPHGLGSQATVKLGTS